MLHTSCVSVSFPASKIPTAPGAKEVRRNSQHGSKQTSAPLNGAAVSTSRFHTSLTAYVSCCGIEGDIHVSISSQCLAGYPTQRLADRPNSHQPIVMSAVLARPIAVVVSAALDPVVAGKYQSYVALLMFTATITHLLLLAVARHSPLSPYQRVHSLCVCCSRTVITLGSPISSPSRRRNDIGMNANRSAVVRRHPPISSPSTVRLILSENPRLDSLRRGVKESSTRKSSH